MRLAVFTNQFPAHTTTFFSRDMRALLEAGIEIDVFAIYPLEPEFWNSTLGLIGPDVLPRDRVHHLGALASVRRLRPWPLKRLKTFLPDSLGVMAAAARGGLGSVAKTGYILPKAWAWAQDFADQYDHVLGYWGGYAATCAYLFHRMSGRRIPYSFWLHAGADLYGFTPFLRQKLLYADSIITCCEFNRKFIHSKFPDLVPAIADRIHVNYHGLDLASFPYQPAGRPRNRILAVGRLRPSKGFEYLLQAIALLQQRGVETELDVLGGDQHGSKDNYQGHLEGVARTLGIASRVRFHGWVTFEVVQKAMSEATMLVHPSSELGDGLPNVIREAMALGTPVIGTEVAGIPEALDRGRCGPMLPPKDVPALADAIERLMGDEALRLQYAAAARQLTEVKFDVWRNGTRLAERLRAAQSRSPAVVAPVPVGSPAA
jgi:glycosyltransferase involved in cell wall biosynthesis